MKPLSGGGSPDRPVSAVNRFLCAWKQEPAADLQDHNFPTDEIASLHPGASKAPVALAACGTGPAGVRHWCCLRDLRWPSLLGRYRLTGGVLHTRHVLEVVISDQGSCRRRHVGSLETALNPFKYPA